MNVFKNKRIDIRDNLDYEINSFIKDSRGYPQGILANPSTVLNLEHYLGVMGIINSTGISKYRGIKVYRTLDVEIGKFKIL